MTFSSQEKQSEYLAPQINQSFSAPVGVVQNGDGSTANTTQNIGREIAEILQLIDNLHMIDKALPIKRLKHFRKPLQIPHF
ncbi:hypothetical protein TUMEXPCC7403_20905 [Tumidithrix helvetica PCC 7403]